MDNKAETVMNGVDLGAVNDSAAAVVVIVYVVSLLVRLWCHQGQDKALSLPPLSRVKPRHRHVRRPNRGR